MKLNDILDESLDIQEDTVGQLASKLMAIFRGTAYEYALKLMKEKGLDAHDAAKVVDGVDARVLAQMVSANESLELTEAPGMIRGVLAALALTAGLAATGPDALEWADQLPDEAKAELQSVIDSGNTAALDKFKAKYGISESVTEGSEMNLDQDIQKIETTYRRDLGQFFDDYGIYDEDGDKQAMWEEWPMWKRIGTMLKKMGHPVKSAGDKGKGYVGITMTDGTKVEVDTGMDESVQEGRMKDMLWDYAEQMDREEFVANAMEFGMSDEEAAEFWDNCNGDLGAEMAKYEESINYMKKLAGL